MRYLAILLILSLATAAAGCGGGGDGGGEPLSKADYEQRMQAVGQEAASALDAFGSASDALTDVEAAVSDINAGADVLEAQSRSLDGLEPPEDVADSHQTLVDTSAAAAEGLRVLADDLQGGTASPADLLGLFEMKEFAELEAAVRAIRARGYDIGDDW